MAKVQTTKNDNKRKIHYVNKRAYFDYDISESIEAGVVLTSGEVKAARGQQVSLQGSFVKPLTSGPGNSTELWLVNAHFAQTQEPDRSRKLLIHKKELERLRSKISEKGMSIVPFEAYFSHGYFKVKIGLARGKKQYEKRETIKKRDVERELKQSVKNRTS